MAPVPTLRRLNDRERYWGLTFPQWGAGALAGGLFYGAVKVSPLATKPTITIVALLGALAGTVLMGVSGQALSPLRQLQAITRYRCAPKQWKLAERPDRRGLVLSCAPLLSAEGQDLEDVDADLLLGGWDEFETESEVSQ